MNNSSPVKRHLSSPNRITTTKTMPSSGAGDNDDMQPLMIDSKDGNDRSIPSGDESPMVKQRNESPALNTPHSKAMGNGAGAAAAAGMNPEFLSQALRFLFCFAGLQISYLTWGYMQELIMTTTFEPTPSAPDGKFPSAAFCVFSNRFLAIIVAIIAVRIRHGAVLANNVAPLVAFAPCALSNTMSSWSQYASLRYVSFPVQTVFKSSKIIPVMIMGKVLKGTSYPLGKYAEAFLITVGVAIFSIASKSSDHDTSTQIIGLLFMCMYIMFDCFTSQWQDKVYVKYGRANVDPYQMMLGVNSTAIIMTTSGLILNGDIPKIIEFFRVNPSVFQYNVITAITSASGQLFIYTTIKEFGPIVFTIIMTTRQMISICISSILFGHAMTIKALSGAVIVFGVLFYQIRGDYMKRQTRSRT
jgi:adenosine 3'-phospho 5'-phosphosulfate transporter B2